MSRRAPRGSDRRPTRGQALIELAVFGTIFLLVLGVMISYGLRYDYSQEAQMRAFRTALKIAANRNYGTGTYMTLQEKHIPDPLNPYGAGSTMTVQGSASVTRDYLAYAPPEIDGNEIDSLPTVVIDQQARFVSSDPSGEPFQRTIYRAAGFRQEKRTDLNIDENNTAAVRRLENLMTKYGLIYNDVQYPKDDEGNYTGELQIQDACVGQVIDYDGCYEQARKIVDQGYCEERCLATVSNPDVECAAVCASVLNAPNQNSRSYNSYTGGPWYAANWQRHTGDFEHRYQDYYEFPILDRMFEAFGIDTEVGEEMGLQMDTAQMQDTRSMRIRKRENSGSLTTDEQANWTTRTTGRRFIRNNNMGSDGWDAAHATPEEYIGRGQDISMDAEWQGDVQETWRTNK